MLELMLWIDRVNMLRKKPGVRRSSLHLAEQLLEDEANNFRTRVLVRATNILMDEGLEPDNGVYHVDFTR